MKFNIQHSFSANEALEFNGVFNSGERIALLGKSGAGKTTLLRYLSGLNRQGNVDINVGGVNNPKAWQSSTVLLHQQPVMFPKHTVERTLGFGQQFSTTSDVDLPYGKWVETLELAPLLTKNCQQLSGGQAQRVALLRALLTKSAWLLLDEPFSALDPQRMVGACHVVAEYCELTGAGIVLASHADFPQRFLCHSAYVVESLMGQPVEDLFGALNTLSHDHKVSTLSVKTQALEYGFLSVGLGNQCLYLREPAYWEGGQARVSIDAESISIAIGDDHQTSMVNRIECLIDSFEILESGTYCMCLNIEQQELFVNVSQWSFERLKLQIGQTVFAEFKVGAVQWHGQAL